MPRGLLIAKCTSVSSSVTRAPSTRITDTSGSTRVPSSVTIRSSTSTRPSRIIFSATRRDAIPACDNTFCKRTPSRARGGPTSLESAISLLVHVERHRRLGGGRPAELHETWLFAEGFTQVVDDVDVGQQRRDVRQVAQRRQPEPLEEQL